MTCRGACEVRFVTDLHQIVGIIRPISAFVLNVIAAAQLRSGLRGSMGEFGAFQGKFTLCLILSGRKEELTKGWFIADAFERLGEFGGNANGGVGCKQCFENQVAQWAPGALEFVHYWIGDNKQLASKDIPAGMGSFRIFSIDGDFFPSRHLFCPCPTCFHDFRFCFGRGSQLCGHSGGLVCDCETNDARWRGDY